MSTFITLSTALLLRSRASPTVSPRVVTPSVMVSTSGTPRTRAVPVATRVRSAAAWSVVWSRPVVVERGRAVRAPAGSAPETPTSVATTMAVAATSARRRGSGRAGCGGRAVHGGTSWVVRLGRSPWGCGSRHGRFACDPAANSDGYYPRLCGCRRASSGGCTRSCCSPSPPMRRPCRRRRIAEFHGVGAPYLSKHLQTLARAGILESVAGARGGYRLARPAAEIRVRRRGRGDRRAVYGVPLHRDPSPGPGSRPGVRLPRPVRDPRRDDPRRRGVAGRARAARRRPISRPMWSRRRRPSRSSGGRPGSHGSPAPAKRSRREPAGVRHRRDGRDRTRDGARSSSTRASRVTAVARTEAAATALRRVGARSGRGRPLRHRRRAHCGGGPRRDRAPRHQRSRRCRRCTGVRRGRSNDRLRVDATRALLDAARVHGIDRVVKESVTFTYRDGGDAWLDESAPLDSAAAWRATIDGRAARRRLHRPAAATGSCCGSACSTPPTPGRPGVRDGSRGWRIAPVPGRARRVRELDPSRRRGTRDPRVRSTRRPAPTTWSTTGPCVGASTRRRSPRAFGARTSPRRCRPRRCAGSAATAPAVSPRRSV